MKIIIILLLSLFSFNLSYAQTQTNTVAFKVLSYDSNGNKAISKEDIMAGQDKFLVRLATPTEVSQHTPGLLLGNDNKNYLPATIQDFQLGDLDKNYALTASEVNKLGIKLALDTSTRSGDKQFQISTLDDNGISYVRLVSNKTGEVAIKIVPTMGSTPIKVLVIELDKF